MPIVAPHMTDEQRRKLAALQPEMVKARLDFRRAIGRAIQRAISLAGWTDKEAAARIWPHRDNIETSQAQLSKWIGGIERPHLDVLFDVEELRWPLVESLALMSETCDVVSGIYRRSA